MSLLSKWESRIIIPTGDWTIDFTHSVEGNQTITLTAANTYYWSSAGNDSVDLAARIKALMDTAYSGGTAPTFTVTVSAGENGTGKLTIVASAGTIEVAATTGADEDALIGGLIGVTAAATIVSNNHVEGLWLPDCHVVTPYGLSSSGVPISTAMVSLAGDGTYTATHGAKFVRNEYTYQMVSVAKVVQASESTVGESYEVFWLDAIRGEEPWANAGRQLRYYKDTDDDATFKTYNILNVNKPEIARSNTDDDAFWSVRLEVAEN